MKELTIYDDGHKRITERAFENVTVFTRYVPGKEPYKCEVDTMQNLLMSEVYAIKNGGQNANHTG